MFICDPEFWILVINRGRGSSGPTAITMLNHILNKGVITDHVKKEFQKNIENPLIYGVFRSQGKK